MSAPRPPKKRGVVRKPAAPEAGAPPPPRPLPSAVGPAPAPRGDATRPHLIRVRGARTHNLRGVDVDLPRDRLVVITGPSGSGKSSLAFDTIYAEGRRRYVETLSPAARTLLDRLPAPDVDLVDGLSPCVALEQSAAGRTPRSTLGTLTDVYDYLRLLFARLGTVVDPRTGAPVRRTTREDVAREILALPEGTRLSIVAPVVEDAPGDHAARLADLLRRGFARIAVDGAVLDPAAPPALAPDEPHTVEVYVDRLVVRPGIEARLREALDLCAELTGGTIRVVPLEGEERTYREHYTVDGRGGRIDEVAPSLFSFNHPDGWCPACKGIGARPSVLAERIVPDPSRSLADGAVLPTAPLLRRSIARALDRAVRALEIPEDVPFEALPPEARIGLFEGPGGDTPAFEGLVPLVLRKLQEVRDAHDANPELVAEVERLAEDERCPTCQGTRLRPEALCVRVAGRSIAEVAAGTVPEVAAFLRAIEPDEHARDVAAVIVEPALRRLGFLEAIGLSYLTLDRAATTLSGGEFQRARLAAQVGASFVGVTYVLDEPSIGLHPQDTARLLSVLSRLRDLGNTVIVVEHDVDTIRAADHVVDMGPGAGRDGGRVLATGTVAEICDSDASVTGAFLSGRRRLPAPGPRRPHRRVLTLEGARGHNLRDVTLRVPLGTLTCVCGVSGSGKSSLVVGTLLRAVARERLGVSKEPLPYRRLRGAAAIDKVIHVDQAPIGRSARSTPATYLGVFTELRKLFAQLPLARMRGFGPAHFSFNVRGGRCEACGGEGVQRVALQFLPDVAAECPACRGRRYGPQVLDILYRGRTIAEILDMTVAEAVPFFAAQPKIRDPLSVLADVGLGYLPLGQPATTLSGGEAQRLKLARELARPAPSPTLYVLDEPTSGLHVADIVTLLRVFDRLVDAGHTVLVIEHDPVVLRHADHLVELGPGGGAGGGRIVAEGTPEHLAGLDHSPTGRHLAPWLALG